MAMNIGPELPLDTHAFGFVGAFDFTPSSQRLAAITEDNSPRRRRLLLFDLGATTPTQEVELPGRESQPFDSLSISPSGTTVAVTFGRDEGFGVYDLVDGHELGRGLPEDGGRCSDISWRSDSSQVAVSVGNVVEFWTAAEGQITRDRTRTVTQTSFAHVASVAVHPLSVHFAAGTSEPATYVFNTSSRSPTLEPRPGVVSGLAWSSDGLLLAAQGFGTGNAVAAWRNATAAVDDPFGPGAELVLHRELSDGRILAKPAWEPEGHRLAVGDSGGGLNIVDVATSAEEPILAPTGNRPIRAMVWRGNHLLAWASFPKDAFLTFHKEGTPPIPTEAPGDCVIQVEAQGPQSHLAPGVWLVQLEDLRHPGTTHASTHFASDGRASFGGLHSGDYLIRFDTKVDVTWGPVPERIAVTCSSGQTETVRVSFQ